MPPKTDLHHYIHEANSRPKTYGIFLRTATMTASKVHALHGMTPEEVLKIVAALLGSSKVDGEGESEGEASASFIKNIVPDDLHKFWNTTELNDDGEISSFPSFSLHHQHSDCYVETAAVATTSSSSHTYCGKEKVESHVASLLSRPILVGNDDDDEEDTTSEDDCTVVKNLKEVPDLMLHNLFGSLCTLVDARLRAYAKFLANHGLSLVEDVEEKDKDSDEMRIAKAISGIKSTDVISKGVATDSSAANAKKVYADKHVTGLRSVRASTAESIAGLGQKLDNLLEIGNHASADAVVTSFSIPTNVSTREKKENNAECVIMPLVMEAFVDITVPHPPNIRGAAQKDFCTTVSFRASGNIQGTFSRRSSEIENAPSSLRLCAIDVEMNANELLSCMMKQAAHIVSIIVDMTNVAGKESAAANSNTKSLQVSKVKEDNGSNGTGKSSKDGNSRRGDKDESKSICKNNNNNNFYSNEMTRPKRRLSLIQGSGGISPQDVSPDLTVLMAPGKESAIPIAKFQKKRHGIVSPQREDCSALSPRRCANIVDEVFGDDDSKILFPTSLPSRRKRVRIL